MIPASPPARADACTAAGTTVISTNINDRCDLGNDTGDNGVSLTASGQLFGILVFNNFTVDQVSNAGNISIDGIVFDTNSVFTGDLTNSGTLISITGDGISVGAGTSIAGQIINTNTGTIDADFNGITVGSAAVNGGIRNDGQITASTGIRLNSTTGSINLTNTGTIIAQSFGLNIQQSTASLVNTGTITTTDISSPKAVVVNGSVLSLSGTGSVTGGDIALLNNSTLNLTGTNTYVRIVDDGSGTLNIVGNATSGGTIQGLGSITVTDGAIFNLGHSYSDLGTVFTVGQGTSGVLNHSAGSIQLNNFTVAAGGAYTQSGTAILQANTTIGSGGTVTLLNQGTGSINGTAAGQGTLVFAGNYDTNAALGGGNALSNIRINDGATLTLDQVAAANTLTIGGGTSGGLLLGGANLIDDSTAVTVNAGATFDLQGNNETIGSLAGAGNTSLGAAALTTGGDNTSTTYSGVLSGSGGLTKRGAGTLTLTGTNTYTGGTTVAGGTLSLGNDDAAGTGTITTTGSVIDYANGVTITNPINVDSDTTQLQALSGVTATQSGIISETGGARPLEKIGAGTLTLSGINSYTGITTISAGTLTLQGGSAIADTGAVTISGGTLDIDTAETIGALSGGGTVNLDAGLTAGDAGNSTYAGVIQGTGGFIKQGSGTLTLTGANTYGGGTIVSGGVLQGDTTSLQGDILNDANVTFEQAATGTYAGVMSGTGSLTKQGTGTLTLTGNNTYTGGTTVSSGTLQGTTTSLQGDITNNANVTFDQTAAGTYADIISGTGTLTKQGTGVLTLTGANTYSGGTTVSGGTLSLGNNNAAGTGTITTIGSVIDYANGVSIANPIDINSDTTQLQALAGVTATQSGNISETGGARPLEKIGAGTLVLSGANIYTGITTISAGTLTLQGGSAITDTGAVTINGGTLDVDTAEAIGSLSGAGTVNLDAGLTAGDATNTTYAGVIQGGSGLTKRGTGTLTLTGASTYTGSTTVDAGILQVDGAIVSTVSLNGGALGGNGAVGGVILNGGTLAPGSSIGTLTVNGNVDFSGGGVYEVEADAAGNADRIEATGMATLAGGSVAVIPEPGDYAPETEYTILTAAGGVNGEFDDVTSTLAFLTPELAYDANNVFLTLERNDTAFQDVASTAAQQGAAAALDAVGVNPGGDFQAVLDALFLLDETTAPGALAQLSGAAHPYAQYVARDALRGLMRMSFGRLGGGGQDPGLSGLALAFNDERWAAQMASHWLSRYDGSELASARGLWVRGYGVFGEFDATANAPGADYTRGGIAAGLDAAFGDHWTAGVVGGYGRTDVDSFGTQLDTDSYQIAAYAAYRQARAYGHGFIGYAWHDVDSTRPVVFPGFNEVSAADYDMHTFGASFEAGVDYAFATDVTLTPFAALDYARTQREAFTESGAAGLDVAGRTEHSLRPTFGVRLAAALTAATGATIEPVVYAAYAHEAGDAVGRLRATFNNAPAASFRIDGPEADRDRFLAGAAINTALTDRADLSLAWDADIAGSDTAHALSATVRYAW